LGQKERYRDLAVGDVVVGREPALQVGDGLKGNGGDLCGEA
jgi:hypothetical protein